MRRRKGGGGGVTLLNNIKIHDKNRIRNLIFFLIIISLLENSTVLIRKPESNTLQPASYRQIELTSIIGKLLDENSK